MIACPWCGADTAEATFTLAQIAEAWRDDDLHHPAVDPATGRVLSGLSTACEACDKPIVAGLSYGAPDDQRLQVLAARPSVLPAPRPLPRHLEPRNRAPRRDRGGA